MLVEALAVYEQDLGRTGDLPVSRQNRGQHLVTWPASPNAFIAWGDPDTGAADTELAAAVRLADQPIASSCYCRGCAPVADNH